MRALPLAGVMVLWAAGHAGAQLRAPSCEVLIAFAQGARHNMIELSFGKPVEDMTADDFATAAAVVSGCIDMVEARPPDIPGLPPRERKSSQLGALTAIAEDLALYRSRQRERLQRVTK